MCTVAAAIQVAASGRSGWLCQSNVPTIPVCSWSGVSCFQSTVTDITLAYYYAQGTLPSTIGLLSHLNYLNLGGNILTGTVPSTLCMDMQLTTLHLDSNNLQCYPTCLTSVPDFYIDDIPEY